MEKMTVFSFEAKRLPTPGSGREKNTLLAREQKFQVRLKGLKKDYMGRKLNMQQLLDIYKKKTSITGF